MKFTDIFIKRPVLAISLSLLIVLLGVQALSKMQVREYPNMTNTVVTVTTSYYGANADLIQGFITQPIEQAIAQADNIDYISSQSTLGSSVITVNMNLNTDPSGAVADILAKVNGVSSQLPSEAEDPTIDVSTGSTTSVIYIAFSSDQLNSSQITDYLQRVIKPQLFSINGVAKVNLYGGTEFAMRIWLDPERMAAFGLSTSEVISILQANNIQSATGQAMGYYTLFNGNAKTQVTSAEELEKLIIATRDDGRTIHLQDIARVSLEKSHDAYRAMANGNDAVVVAIDSTPTANPLDITADVRDMLPSLEKSNPSSINMEVLYDSTIAIEESIEEVVKTIAEAGLIVLIVMILFLGSWRAVLIPIITIPLSLIGVAVVMQVFGFTINLMTLLAMVLAIGLVVDDAIVVVENIDRHIKAGEDPFRAAIIGTREIAVPVISMTITLAAVYAPIALMGGITGSLFTEFALTLAGAVFVSGIVALTLSPMMCSKMLTINHQPNRFERSVDKVLTGLTNKYGNTLDVIMTRRPAIIIFAILVFISLPYLFKFIPSELAPKEDKGVLMMLSKAPSNANLDFIENSMRLVTDEISRQPEVESSLAMSGIPNANQAFGIAIMKPWSQREKGPAELSATLTPAFGKIPSVATVTFQRPELPGSSGGLPVQFVITTSNPFQSLVSIATDVLAETQANPNFVYSELDLAFDSATMNIKIDRDKAGAYGVTMQDIGITLGTLLSDGYLNRINLIGRSYEVIAQVERKYRLAPEKLGDFYVPAKNGDMVPLSELITIDVIAEPRSLPHFNQLNSATVGAVLSPGVTMGTAITFFEGLSETKLPQGYTHDYLGEARQFVTEGGALYITFILALFIIFLVLASQFESMRDPLVIIMTVPLAISGALMVLAWGAATMNIYTQVGLITLVGLITKHGILIAEVAKEEQLHHGLDRIAAVTKAATVRLRPILMTTAAMVAGLIPLLFASGAGAVSRFGIGIVIVAGLSIGTLFTLFILPVIYSFIASKHKASPEFDEDKVPMVNSKAES
ncbi:multidrug efflux RND transporter permease subunit [Psychromonas sp. 14N.309.X.WAT.B.A12]|uniref:multidrug efflux RND transporter permease subunit n=1 Tax=Psychromonas sp. 14N.309.X.WAT.B.A12 TaxID=2998322 RepID=UPI0025B2427E|nr:multidrug efflux RND transporter permease subunit [Psychromonas sp. 14N.309.X.WAT.B.A12]MDN2664008.1 multidrug efflux RND transporter permease subunit [Psychromonas sp. 14N.309.X.WAT.B.A12]